LRITYVTDSYPPIVGGVSYVVQNLAENMAARGHEVEVVTIDNSLELPRVSEENGVVVRRILGLRPGGYYHFPSPEILREINRQTDILHVHNFHSVLPLVCALAKDSTVLRSNKVVVSPHYHRPGIHFHSKIAWLPYMQFLKREIQNFDVVHCVSEFESHAVHRDFDVEPVVVSNGIAPDTYTHSWTRANGGGARPLKVMFVGRLEKYKRLDLVVEALARVQREGIPGRSGLEFTAIGSGPELRSLMELARRKSVRIKHRNRVEREELLGLYSSSDCLVNCSQYEAYSIVTGEALAIGTPVVIAKPWGVNWVNYPRATIVDPDVESVAEGIKNSVNLENGGGLKRVPTWPEIVDRMCSDVYNT
jgi:glycosyltransferase involved in cell wall biosynthesis